MNVKKYELKRQNNNNNKLKFPRMAGFVFLTACHEIKFDEL